MHTIFHQLVNPIAIGNQVKAYNTRPESGNLQRVKRAPIATPARPDGRAGVELFKTQAGKRGKQPRYWELMLIPWP
ncbi:MAG: hypothetical protein OXG77_02460 [Chloroflexi bacterium]|nr:hypothetical protein [Chloroflexota bacterium]